MTSTLTAQDRCDRCSAAALTRYDVGGLDLQFCGHHDNENRAALLDKGATLVADDRLLAEATAGLDDIAEGATEK